MLDRWMAWAATRRVALPPHARVVGVGGDVRGGAGRTPLAIALARALGEGVVFVGHGYGGAARAPRVVRRGDEVGEVGDEALVAARTLVCPVVVGPRERALHFAAELGSILVVDRLLQTRPVRLACSVLATHALVPPSWRVRVADVVARVGSSDLREVVQLERSAPARFGLVTSLARPERVVRSLVGLGLVAQRHVVRGDHAPFGARELRALARTAREEALEAWVVDAKTEVLLAGRDLGSPTICLRHAIDPTPTWLARVRAFVGVSG
ncbi:MAG: tetraacyldisaccharide 4'-kinase [Myxococcales bacterium]|nr:tetraacyldisaccharide 4'-kinase [Myxococcales bacterium]